MGLTDLITSIAGVVVLVSVVCVSFLGVLVARKAQGSWDFHVLRRQAVFWWLVGASGLAGLGGAAILLAGTVPAPSDPSWVPVIRVLGAITCTVMLPATVVAILWIRMASLRGLASGVSRPQEGEAAPKEKA